jgi:O-antigen/teichoic acid export membrane protein
LTENVDSALTIRLATNTLVQAVGSGLASVISFFIFVAVTRGLGPEAFGDFTAATVFLFIPVVLADVGLSTAVLREISASPERTESAMRASLPLRALISGAAILVALVVGLAMPFNEQTKIAILISSVGAFLTLMTLSLLPVLQAQLKMHWAVGANLAGRLATLGLTLGALAVGLGFKSIVGAHVLGLAVTFVLHLVAVALIVPLRPVIDLAYWRRLVVGSLALGIAVSISLIYFRVDTVLLALLRSPEEVGLYGAAFKFIELVVLVPAAVGISMFPPLARFIASGDPRATGLIQRAFDVLLAAAVPFVVLMVAYPDEILTFAAGSEYADGAVALQLLAPFALFAFVNAVLWRVVLAGERDLTLLAIAAGVLAGNVVLNLIFIPEYGLKAAAVITVVSEALVTIPIAYAARLVKPLPSLRYAPVVAGATAAMTAIVLFVPGPPALVAALAGTAYLVVLLLLPGTARDVVVADLLPAAGSVVRRRL